MFKNILIIVSLLTTSIFCKDVHVRGYYRKNGTYVAPHYKSSPDGNFYNNWSTKGNVNPHTGKMGTKHYPSDRDIYRLKTEPSYQYSSDTDDHLMLELDQAIYDNNNLPYKYVNGEKIPLHQNGEYYYRNHKDSPMDFFKVVGGVLVGALVIGFIGSQVN